MTRNATKVAGQNDAGRFPLHAADTDLQTLKYADHEPLGGMSTTFIKEVFFAEIVKESQGRLKIEDHWNSKLARSYDALSVVKEGKVADMAIVVPEYTPKEFPLQQIFKSSR